MAELSDVTGVLEDAFRAVPKDAPMHVLHMTMHDAQFQSDKSDPRLTKLIDALKSIAILKVFDGSRLHALSVAWQTLDYWHLASWLIARTSAVGTRQALSDVERYVHAVEIPCEVVMVTTGIEPAEAYDMGLGVRFIPWRELPDSPQKQSTHEAFFGSFRPPNGVMVKEHAVKKHYVVPGEAPDKLGLEQASVDDLVDAVTCVSLVGPFACQVIASWVKAPDWTPIYINATQYPMIEGFPGRSGVTNLYLNQAAALFRAFRGLGKKEQARLRLISARLIRAMCKAVVPVDAAIDLGIAMEGLFLNDLDGDRGELSFRLRVRAARYLGENEAKRLNFMRIARAVYDMRSIAVHTGKVDHQFNGRMAQEWLNDGFALAAAATRRMIAEGPPNWESVTFA